MQGNASRWCAVAALVLAAAPMAYAKPFKWSSQRTSPHWTSIRRTMRWATACMRPSTTRWSTTTARPSRPSRSWPPRGSEVSPTQVRFKLRQGVKFHDGTPFTADDVVFSIDRAMSKTLELRGSTPRASTGCEEGRRPHRRLHHQGPEPGAAAPADRAAHHEQGLGREEQRRRAAGLSRTRKRPTPRATPTAPGPSC